MSARQEQADIQAISAESPRSGAAVAASPPLASKSPASDGPARFRETRTGWLVLALVWLACALYTGAQLRAIWFPKGARTIAQAAERILHGQLAHRDFLDQYTGGPTYLNALALRVFGENLVSQRILPLLFFLGWVPAVYFIGRRFVRPITAGLVIPLAIAWSVVNYPEAMASWYNLLFGTWCTLALIRYTETNRRRCPWAAGLIAGLSFLCKITAVYFLAAALLFFVFRELQLSRDGSSRPLRESLVYRLFASASLPLFLAGSLVMISGRPAGANYTQFAFPSAALVGYLLWELWSRSSERTGTRFRRLFSMALPVLGGAAIPVCLFLLWYARAGALGDWFRGTFVGGLAHI
jgi:4-amino-4-deoxy-L-arabinose transferase-like glycosyltransferase